MHRFYIGKKYLPYLSVGKNIFPRGNLPTPPPPLKVKWFSPNEHSIFRVYLPSLKGCFHGLARELAIT